MDNRRLILLVVFSFSLVMLWDAWQKYSNPPLPTQSAAVSAGARDASVPVPSAAQPAAASSAAVPAVLSAPTIAKGDVVSIKTDLFVADVSTQGGDLVGLVLNNYKAIDDKEKNFPFLESKHQFAAQSGLIGEGLPNHKTVFAAVAGSRELTGDAKTVQLRLVAPAVDGV